MRRFYAWALGAALMAALPGAVLAAEGGSVWPPVEEVFEEQIAEYEAERAALEDWYAAEEYPGEEEAAAGYPEASEDAPAFPQEAAGAVKETGPLYEAREEEPPGPAGAEDPPEARMDTGSTGTNMPEPLPDTVSEGGEEETGESAPMPGPKADAGEDDAEGAEEATREAPDDADVIPAEECPGESMPVKAPGSSLPSDPVLIVSASVVMLGMGVLIGALAARRRK